MRKLLIIPAILLALYALAGFLVFPFALKFFGQRALQEKFGAAAKVERVQGNPFTWELSVEGVSFADLEGVWSVQCDRASVDLSARTVLEFYPVLDAIRFDGAKLSYLRRAVEPGQDSEEASRGWRELLSEVDAIEIPEVRIDLLEVRAGEIHFKDASHSVLYSQDVVPVDFTVRDFTTVLEGESENAMRFSAQMDSGASFEWEGRFSRQLLGCVGSVRLDGLNVQNLAPYYVDYVRFDLESAVFDVRFDYRLDLADLDHVFSLSDGALELSDVVCLPTEGEERVIALKSARLDGVRFDFPEMNLQVGHVVVEDGVTRIERDSEGQVNLLRLVGTSDAADVAEVEAEVAEQELEASDGALAPLAYSFDSIELLNYRVVWVDSLPSGVATIEVSVPTGEITGVSSDFSASFLIEAEYGFGESGRAHLSGQVTPAGGVLDLNMVVEAFPLSFAAEYAKEFARMDLRGGSLSFDGKLVSHSGGGYQITGSGGILDADFDVSSASPWVVHWAEGSVDGLDVVTQPFALRLDRLGFGAPVVEWRMMPKGAEVSVEVADIVPDGGAAGDSEPLDLVIRELVIDSGAFTLVDHAVQPTTDVVLEALGLTVGNIAFDSDETTTFELKSMLNQGHLLADGQFDLANPRREFELTLSMSALQLPQFSSYSGRGVGREISSGVFSVDAEWVVEASQLKASNKVVIDDLSFGKRVESESAVKLPLDLAVTLLSGANGTMDLSLPLKGDLSNPEVKVWKIMRTAAIGLVTNVVSSPFKLLSGLVKSDVDMSQIEFSTNDSQLTSGSMKRLKALAHVFKARENIDLSMTAVLSEADDAALVRESLCGVLLPKSPNAGKAHYRRALKKAYHRKMKDVPEGGRAVLSSNSDQAVAQMEAVLLEDYPMSDELRAALGNARAEAVRQYLIEQGGIAESRLTVGALDPEQGASVVRFDLK